jgi:uncharacterized protein (DUF1697 family)
MPRYAAFLRGINVSGRRATSAQLCDAFRHMGLQDPATFRASGNVIFTAKGAADKLSARIQQGLASALGFDVAAFVRTGAEIAAIAAYKPFDAGDLEASAGKLQVALLPAKPTVKARKQMLALQSEDDLLHIHGRELYWLPSGGLMKSAIGMDGVTAALGPNTVRTKGTIEQLAAKYFGA